MKSISSYDPSNIFGRILQGEIPCRKVYEDIYALAFHDIQPKAPIHLLVIPRGPYLTLLDFTEKASSEVQLGFWRAVQSVARQEGLEEQGFRLISNCGLNGGQEVPHFHVHLLGGKVLGKMV
ncbi:MAG: histidine triad nucleotide-binding protein [Alphaproteobacteria bacterium]